jgi:hypothetical protein
MGIYIEAIYPLREVQCRQTENAVSQPKTIENTANIHTFYTEAQQCTT